MIDIKIADITLREEGKPNGYTLSFKEKIEVAKILDKLNVDVIETAPITNGRTDVLFLHSIAPIVKNSIISCPVGLDEEEAEKAYDAIKGANKPRLHVLAPVSTVQMEYISNKKPKVMLESLAKVVSKAKSLCEDVEVSLLDATRAERDFLCDAIRIAIENGAKTITVCDSAGEMLPTEFAEFLDSIFADVSVLKDVNVSVEVSDSLNMAAACTVSCIGHGVTQIKTSVISESFPKLGAIARVFREKGDALGVTSGINMAVLDNSINKISLMTNSGAHTSPFDAGTNQGHSEDINLSADEDIQTVKVAIATLGYELSEEDITKVYDEVVKNAKSKKVGAKELDAIVASVAMQVVSTYKLKSYVINNGNIITTTAHIELERDGVVYSGVCIGDGPVDAAFLAIEQITGHHFELDGFQVQAVTEGREAMGSSVVKLRHNGKPYSGKGISTDIIGASINAYINALNKICFEEDVR